ncbi:MULTISPECIES: electron transfer flavoprotein subunit alpha/FixB family protein [Paenibacillus]|uniref:Electron transfer flavoprotein subunit alpha n=1 Tax=Paenibacillus campinasensis TaxID=66347 RepID=A0A268EG64_9BACL|nr:MULTISPECIES: electron transfer flavoprotein subunit alpha/FixB family protein [Paenibacillus]MUG67271.1 electron transfer flavoprotein subunit alpha/FixB family protein [Paenibacillus campinasensis]PAD72125.1 electron transfer flavoprotein subunit alpha [Paenibacillus campinasensis]PAK49062.1 electron transfer flavoprotein subunit alpha [Paenibacillus sp. 7541]
MSKTILVYAENRDGKLRQVALETLGAARRIAADGDSIRLVVIGSNVTEAVTALKPYGAETIYTVEHDDLEHYNPDAYVAAIAAVLNEAKPDAVLFGHTAIGRDLAPLIAASLGAGQISDVTTIESEDGQVVFTRPLYAGKAFEKRVFENGPWVVTVRPNNIPPAEPSGSGDPAIEDVAYPTPSLRAVIKEVVRNTTGTIDLSEAKVVVSGGRGVKSAEGFKPLEELADLLGGAVGASRGACDAGYCDYALQIGQTGKVVTPEIYIACGISGAIQHLAGMSQSRVIIAINKDPEAPIFKVADYGIVGDLFDIVPLLTEEFRKVLVS